MSPEAVELAKRQVRLRFVEEAHVFHNGWNEMSAHFVGNGGLRSTRYALTAQEFCQKEVLRRARIVWEIIQDIIDKEGYVSSDDNRNQVEAILIDAVGQGSEEVEKTLKSRTAGLLATVGDLSAGRKHAVESVLAAFDVYMLGRNKRRPSLDDMLGAPRYEAAREHWRKANDFAGAKPADLPNAVKEAVSAVESLAQIVVGKTGLTLGDAVKALRSAKRLPTGADKILEGLYAFASDAPGARHGSALPADIDPKHWEFVRDSSRSALKLLLNLDS